MQILGSPLSDAVEHSASTDAAMDSMTFSSHCRGLHEHSLGEWEV